MEKTKDGKMTCELRDAWIANLCSGKFEQAHGALKTYGPNPKYCCLGVLCVTAGVRLNNDCDGEPLLPPMEYRDLGNINNPIIAGKPFGLTLDQVDALWRMNDGRSGSSETSRPAAAFPEIAAWIKSNVECAK